MWIGLLSPPPVKLGLKCTQASWSTKPDNFKIMEDVKKRPPRELERKRGGGNPSKLGKFSASDQGNEMGAPQKRKIISLFVNV